MKGFGKTSMPVQWLITAKSAPPLKKNVEPTTLILDAQSVKNSATATEQIGFDGGKLIKGRKLFMLIDTPG